MSDPDTSCAGALSMALRAVRALPAEDVPITEATGRVAAHPVFAFADCPPTDISLRDGYALLPGDGGGGALRMTGVASAGHPFDGAVIPGTAVRVLTGAVIPAGAGAVVADEECDVDGELVRTSVETRAGRNILERGAHVAAGTLLVTDGELIRPSLAGLMAAAGMETVSVIRRPRVAVLAVGDELALPGANLHHGEVYASNLISIAAWCRDLGMEIISGVARDDETAIAGALERMAPQADAVVTCGGAGRSERDLVTAALAGLGWVERYHHVRCLPGKTTSMGEWDGIPVFCLPGSPGANLAAFLVLALPALLRLAGRTAAGLGTVRAEIAEPVLGDPIWTRLLPGLVEQQGSRLVFHRSHRAGGLQEMARASALLVMPEGAAAMQAGAVAEVLLMPGAPLPATTLPPPQGSDDVAPPVVSFVSKSGCGRTTFIEKLLPELTALGIRTGILKHHVHASGFDVPGKDTDRLSRAGAAKVVGLSPMQIALFEQVEGAEPESLVRRFMADLDLVLTDGLKRAAFPKIEVHRAACSEELICEPGGILALVTDEPMPVSVPQFAIEDAAGVARFLEDWASMARRRR